MVKAEASALGNSNKPVCCAVKCKMLVAKIGTANSAPYNAMPITIDSKLPAHSER